VPHDIAYAPAATTATASSRTRTIAAKAPVAFIAVPIGYSTGKAAAAINSREVTPPADTVTIHHIARLNKSLSWLTPILFRA